MARGPSALGDLLNHKILFFFFIQFLDAARGRAAFFKSVLLVLFAYLFTLVGRNSSQVKPLPVVLTAARWQHERRRAVVWRDARWQRRTGSLLALGPIATTKFCLNQPSFEVVDY